MTTELMVKYAIRGAQAELSELKMKLDAVNALLPGMADVTRGEKERMARALNETMSMILADIHELQTMPGSD